MRLRCIAFLPPAALITGLLFLLTSSMVSVLGAALLSSDPLPNERGEGGRQIELVRYETECEFLQRRIEEVARSVRSCEALPGCLQTQNLCPVSMQEELAREYEGLRDSVLGRCTDVPTSVSRASPICSNSALECSDDGCEFADAAEASILPIRTPNVFFF